MPGRVSIGKSTHGLTSATASGSNQSLVTSTPTPFRTSPARKAARTTLLGPLPTTFLPRRIVRPLTAFERAVIAFDPVKPVKKAAKSAVNAVKSAVKAVKKFFSGW